MPYEVAKPHPVRLPPRPPKTLKQKNCQLHNSPLFLYLRPAPSTQRLHHHLQIRQTLSAVCVCMFFKNSRELTVRLWRVEVLLACVIGVMMTIRLRDVGWASSWRRER